MNAAEVQQVLEDRATALARPPTGQIGADAIELVVLQVGGERYGIDVRLVREVRPPVGLVPVPGTPEFWSGLVNLRGSLCPVLSLRRYLRRSDRGATASLLEPSGPPAGPETGGPGVLVVVTAPFVAGLLADAAAEVRRVTPGQLQALGGTSPHRAHAAIQAITADLLQLLDPGVLLADPALVVGREAN